MKFIDEAKVIVKSGKGGKGCCSFHREKFIEFGGPDGGDGGDGGDVIVVAQQNLNTLVDYRFQQHHVAKNGEHGMGSGCFGQSREPLVLKVPVGTQIFLDDHETLFADLKKDGDKAVLAKGGRGGKGNARFKTSTNQAPRKTTPGEEGEEREYWFKLKLISDAGLVGLPNAGKSTFLSVISRAKPKIANYPFTTLTPNLGVVNMGYEEFIVADIPGLIEGASEGHGLGTKFLGHVERCGTLIHLIDGTEEDVVGNYKIIRAELKEYGGGLAKKKEVLVLNKCDSLTDEEIADKLAKLKKASKKAEIFTISAIANIGVDKVLQKVFKQVKEFRESQKEG